MPESDSKRSNPTQVVPLEEARERRRCEKCRGRLSSVLELNRSVLRRLFETGLVFTRTGSRIGRELLQCQHQLLRAGDELKRGSESGTQRRGARHSLARLLERVEALLEKALETTRRHESLLGTKES
ncbi:MAG: hypothetical protein RL199_1096 [Pseudomonadota bacterium]|jgi:hypothetical protein